MDNYRAPIEDMQFLIDEVLQIEQTLGELEAYRDKGVNSELTTAVLDEAARLANDVLAPLRRIGDTHPAQCVNQQVECSPGHEDALAQLGEAGWTGIAASEALGGQGLPELYGTATSEMWNGANMAFALAPFLSSGAALAIAAHGTEEQRALYATRINSGLWSGTMNLTESGAGSDLGPVKTRAVPEGDHYRIFGQKIYITWGDHSASENIIHLVLAHPGADSGGETGPERHLIEKPIDPHDIGTGLLLEGGLQQGEVGRTGTAEAVAVAIEVAGAQGGAQQVLAGEAGIEVQANVVVERGGTLGGTQVLLVVASCSGERVRAAAAVAVSTQHEGGDTFQLGGSGELGCFQLTNLGLEAIHAALQHGEFLFELLHQALQLVGHVSDPVEASVQQGGRFKAGHRTAAAVGAVGVAGHTAVALDQVAQSLISPVGGLHVGELGDRSHLLLRAVLADASNVEFAGSCSHRSHQAQGSRCQKKLLEQFHGPHTKRGIGRNAPWRHPASPATAKTAKLCHKPQWHVATNTQRPAMPRSLRLLATPHTPPPVLKRSPWLWWLVLLGMLA